MAGISLQKDVVYGPILSRRLGRSFGINLLPLDRKICTFDCVYCQYGPSEPDQENLSSINFPTLDAVLSRIENVLRKPRSIDYLTFSGNGEPTLHPEFPAIVDGVVKLRDKLRPDLKLAIFSNGTQFNRQSVLRSLQKLDAPMIKLDAGDEITFQSVNRPSQPVDFWQIIEGMRGLKNLIIQSMVFTGPYSISKGASFTAWVDLLKVLNPIEIHVYSIARPTACVNLEAVGEKRLKAIVDDIVQTHHLPARFFV